MSVLVADKSTKDERVCLNMLYLLELGWETKQITVTGLLNSIEIKLKWELVFC